MTHRHAPRIVLSQDERGHWYTLHDFALSESHNPVLRLDPLRAIEYQRLGTPYTVPSKLDDARRAYVRAKRGDSRDRL
jgi:hypothetical protein